MADKAQGGTDYEALAKAAYNRSSIPTEWDVDVRWEAAQRLIRGEAIEGVRAIIDDYREQQRTRGVVCFSRQSLRSFFVDERLSPLVLDRLLDTLTQETSR